MMLQTVNMKLSPFQVEIEFGRNTCDNMLRVATLEELYERNGKALGMDFTIDEDVLKNESGTSTSSVDAKEQLCTGHVREE